MPTSPTRRERPLTVVTPYGRGGGSSRVRVYDWLDHLALDADVHAYRGDASNRPGVLGRHPLTTLAAEARTRRLRPGSGPLLLSREATPLSTGRLEARLLGAASHGVYDVDDALFHDTGTGLRALLSKAATWDRAVAAADVVIAGNAYLADRASRGVRPGGEVVVVPSCVEPADFPAKASYALGDPPRLVWVGSPSTEPHLLGVAPSLLEVHRRTGARLEVVSAGDAPLGPLDVMVDRTPWRAQTLAERLAAADVAVGPLTDSPYARGKCAYKLLQYAAAGLPSVASPVGANAPALAVLSGSAATSASEWVDALVALIEAPAEARRRLGAAARAGVAAHYSFDRWAPDWRAAVLR